MSRNQKVKRELKSLFIDNETLPTLSSVEGNNIAERLKQRRRGKSRSQIEIKRVELENPFVIPKKSRRGAKRKRKNEFMERLEESEFQIMQQEQEVTAEESDSEWEPWGEVTPTRNIRRLKGNIVSVVIESKDVVETSTGEERRRFQNSKETQEEKKELDVVASLLAMANGKDQMIIPERAAGNLTAEEINLKTPEPVSRGLTPFFNVAPHQIKRGPKKVDYEIIDLTTLAGPSQPVMLKEPSMLTRSERFFENDATQQKRSRVKNTPTDMSSSFHIKAFPSAEMKHAEELQNLDQLVTRHFNRWENELNSNRNVLLYGCGSKEHILETYQVFDSKNENTTWVHLDGSGDLTTMNDDYLILLDKTFGPNHVFKNYTLIGKALAIRDYYHHIVSRIKFKIIVHNIDGCVFQNVDARYALNLLGDIPNIYLLATSENISSCLEWYVDAEDKINWHTHEVTRFINYKLTVTSKVNQDNQLEIKELKSVLTSWNTYRRGMFAMLADHIVTATKRGETNGDSLDFNTLFKYCLENLICQDEKTFRRYLEDFYCHGVFLAKRTPSGEVRITIPISLHDLKMFLLDEDIFGDIN